VRRDDNLTTFKCRFSGNLEASTSWNPQGLSRPVMGLLYLFDFSGQSVNAFKFLVKLQHLVWTAVLLKIQSSGMWCCVTGQVVADINHGSRCLPNISDCHQSTRGNIPEDLYYNLQLIFHLQNIPCTDLHTMSSITLCSVRHPEVLMTANY
jgi:hypothetical protein